jgi:hypothetical protein
MILDILVAPFSAEFQYLESRKALPSRKILFRQNSAALRWKEKKKDKHMYINVDVVCKVPTF